MIQLFVKAPPGNGYTTPQAMKRVSDHTESFFGLFNCPQADRLPVMGADGTWEVRCFGPAGPVRYILVNHYGLEIVREAEL